jgi:hypothetical protein
MTSDAVRWGLSLKDCNLGSLDSLPCQILPAFRGVQLAVNQITEYPVSVMCSTLEDILSATQFPAQLTTLNGTSLARSCTKLIRAYTRENDVSYHNTAPFLRLITL